MQRFKNLTKKSGKVASAILSAAMVTSMVLGTNVVEVKAAQNDDAETEANVQATTSSAITVNKDYEAVQKAKEDLIATVKGYNINVATQATEDGFAGPEAALELRGVVVTGSQITVTKIPTETETGIAKYTTTISKNDYSTPVVVTYTLDSLETRAEKARKAVAEGLEKKIPATNFIGQDDVTIRRFYSAGGTKDYGEEGFVDTATEILNEKDENGILKFSDVYVNQAHNFDVNKATDVKAGSAKATVEVAATNAFRNVNYEDRNELYKKQATVYANAKYSKTIDSNQTRINNAKKAVDTYLQSEELRYSDKSVFDGTTDSDDVTGIIYNYIANDYPDIDVDLSKVETEVTDNNSQNEDGNAKVTFRLVTNLATVDDPAYIESADTKDLTFKLLSDETKAKKAFADAEKVVQALDPAKVSPIKDSDTGVTTAGAIVTIEDVQKAYYKAFGDKLGKEYDTYLQKDLSSANEDPTVPGKYVLTDILYPDATVTIEYLPVDASAGKDGNPKVIVTAESGNVKVTKEVNFTVPSTQSILNSAVADVNAALDAMTVTNETTKDDVLTLVNKVLKDNGYADKGVVAEVVAFDKTDATGDKEGTININVLLTDTKNNIKKNATATKKFTFLSNTFVEKDGKKYYYNKEGKLLKNTFLQGTESPDGYTYYIQNDGSVMQDRLTYHPNGKEVIYFDKDGHEVFDAFVNVKKDVQGNPVDYIGYFGTLGYAYINQTTYGNGEGAYSKDALFYINDYGVLENKGWFQNAAGNIGYAAANGTLTTNQWGLDQFGRKVYFQANGFLAKGLITDGAKYYQLDENDGHLVGEF